MMWFLLEGTEEGDETSIWGRMSQQLLNLCDREINEIIRAHTQQEKAPQQQEPSSFFILFYQNEFYKDGLD